MNVPEKAQIRDRPAVTTPCSVGGRGMVARVVLGGLWNLGAQGTLLLTGIIVTPFVIRYLGTEEYGLLTLITLLIGYLGFADLGMGVASTKFGAEALARGDRDGESAVVWTSMLVTMLPVLAFAGFLAFLGRLLLEGIFALSPRDLQHAGPALRIAAGALIASAATGVFNTSQLVRMKVGLNSGINVACRIGQALFTLVVLFAGGRLVAVTGVIAFAAISTACLNFVVSARLSPGILQPRVDRHLVAPLLRFGAAVVAAAVIGTVVIHGEKFLLVRFASVAKLAYYNVSVTLAGVLGMIPAAISVPLMPGFVQLRAAGDRVGSQRVYGSMLRLIILGSLPAAVILCVLARPFIAVWAGPDFGRESALPLYVLAFGWLFHSASYVPRSLLPAWNQVGLLPRYQAYELVPYFMLSAVLISRFGGTGAAAAWSLRVIFEAFLLFRATRRICGIEASLLGGNQAGYASAIACLFIPVGLVLFISSPLPVLFGVTAVSVACYGLLIRFFILTREETIRLRSLISGMVRG